MGVEVGKAERTATGLFQSGQTSKHDAAVSADHDRKAAARCGHRHSGRECPRIPQHLGLVAGTMRRPLVVAIRQWRDVAEIDCIETRDETALPQDTGSAVHVAGWPVVVRTSAEIRRRSDHGKWAGGHDYSPPLWRNSPRGAGVGICTTFAPRSPRVEPALSGAASCTASKFTSADS